jgi:hypothetical protein
MKIVKKTQQKNLEKNMKRFLFFWGFLDKILIEECFFANLFPTICLYFFAPLLNLDISFFKSFWANFISNFW